MGTPFSSSSSSRIIHMLISTRTSKYFSNPLIGPYYAHDWTSLLRGHVCPGQYPLFESSGDSYVDDVALSVCVFVLILVIREFINYIIIINTTLSHNNCQSGLHLPMPMQWVQIILLQRRRQCKWGIGTQLGTHTHSLLINFTVTGVECDYAPIVALLVIRSGPVHAPPATTYALMRPILLLVEYCPEIGFD